MKKILLSVVALTMIVGAALLNSCTQDDTTAPVITLTGANPQTLTIGQAYTELGATANDSKDGDLTTSIVIDHSQVNVNLKGHYTVTYTVADKAGNKGTASRNVYVVNSLDNLEGSYSATDDWNSDGTVEYTWTETITPSSTVNNELVFSKFANYTGCQLKVDVSGTTISYVAAQTFMCGAAGSQQNRTFSNITGSIAGTVLTIHYHEVDNDGFTTDGLDTFTKQ